MNRSGLARQIARLALVAATCVALYGLPAQAAGFTVSVNFSNWFQGHSAWSQRCYSEPQNGHWGRSAAYDGWCGQNSRFRGNQPDQQWRHDHPWDHGNQQDQYQPPQSPARIPDDGNSK